MNDLTKSRFILWVLAVFKIPLIGYVNPKLVEWSPEKMVIKIKLRKKTRNHLGSMYFGALAVGADLAGGFHAYRIAEQKKCRLSIVFKYFRAEFIKRPEQDVYFVSYAGKEISDMIESTQVSQQRITQDIDIKAFINYPKDPQCVAEFTLGLSLKVKNHL